LNGRNVLILRSCLGAWIKDLNYYNTKRGAADLSVNDANYVIFGLALMNPMNNKLKYKYDARVKIIKAMAHSTRLFIIDELSKKEKCVCELQKMIGDDFSTVSKHLTLLKNAGLVSSNKRGNQVFYKIAASCAGKIICCADNIIKNKLKEETKISEMKV